MSRRSRRYFLSSEKLSQVEHKLLIDSTLINGWVPRAQLPPPRDANLAAGG